MISGLSFRRSLRLGVVVFLPICLAWMSCSNTKDTFVSRTFHNLSAHYNGYYNAGLKLQEGNDKLAASHVDHYDRILKVFQYADAAKSKAIYPQLEDAMKRTSTVISRHTIYDKRGNEKPGSEKWIDDNWLLYGKCQFFKHDYFEAIETFKYIEATYKTQSTRHLASLWIAKTYLELTQLKEAEDKLDYVRNQSDFPKKNIWEREAVFADFYLQTKNYDKAIEHLTRAAALVKVRETKIRFLFILAQLHQQKNEINLAYDLYTKVIKMNPPYEMGFNARLNRARCSDANSGNNETVRKELEQMKDDPKNKDFLDQIYYALAGLAKNEGKEDEQIALLNESVRASTTNTNQKALSYLELGKLSFAKKDYRNAQAYYDSTTTSLSNDYPDYTEILARRNSLTKLVKNLRVIDTEDSLQRLASLSPQDLQKRVDEMVEAESEARKKEQEEKQSNQIFQLNTQKANQFNNTGGSNWYFYNPQAISFGFNEFAKKFGERKLEDDWRRSSKQNDAVNNDQLEEITSDTTQAEDKTGTFSADKRKAEILKGIPSGKEAIDKSVAKIIEAYYNVGMIYREQLNDLEASSKTFEELLSRYPKNKYELQCYYQLYRSYLTLGKTAQSDHYKNIILNEHGDTEYAEIIRNPNYAYEKANTKTKLELFYEETYRKYLNGEYLAVIQRKGEADAQFNKNILTPKFDLLKTLSIGRTQPLPTFEASLNDIIRNYGDDPVKDQAQDILDAIHNGSAKGPVKTDAPESLANDSIKKILNPYNYIPDTTHYVIIIFQNIGGAIDGTKLKTKLSNFNTKNYATKSLEIQDVLLDHRNKMIIVKNFNDRTDALEYNSNLFDNDEVYGNTSTDNYQEYVISVNNYSELVRQKKTDLYEDFFRNFYK